MDAVGLAEAAGRPAVDYSLGMRQRLGIAQALVGRPELVVLDEPMNGLDPAAIHLVRNLIETERRERGVTFFLSSHLLHDVETLCDEVGIIHRGVMVAEGRIDELLSGSVSGFRLHTQNDETALRALKEALPDLCRTALDLEGQANTLGRRLGLTIHDRRLKSRIADFVGWRLGPVLSPDIATPHPALRRPLIEKEENHDAK